MRRFHFYTTSHTSIIRDNRSGWKSVGGGRLPNCINYGWG